MHGIRGGDGELWGEDDPVNQAPKRTEWPELLGTDARLARGAFCALASCPCVSVMPDRVQHSQNKAPAIIPQRPSCATDPSSR